MNRLLLLACSARKRSNPGRLPAIERYDGPAFRVLRRYERSQPHDMPDVYVLSAQFGLIRGDEPIPVYDRRMTPQRAHELQDSTVARLQSLDLGGRYRRVFLHAGALYRQIISSPVLDALPQEQLASSTGSQGVQLAHLKSWLYQGAVPSPLTESAAVNGMAIMKFRLRGNDYEVTRDDAFTVARSALKNGADKSQRATAWYVLIDDQPISPKWLVSHLTGLPVGDFHSIEARRVLTQLGMTVRQA